MCAVPVAQVSRSGSGREFLSMTPEQLSPNRHQVKGFCLSWPNQPDGLADGPTHLCSGMVYSQREVTCAREYVPSQLPALQRLRSVPCSACVFYSRL